MADIWKTSLIDYLTNIACTYMRRFVLISLFSTRGMFHSWLFNFVPRLFSLLNYLHFVCFCCVLLRPPPRKVLCGMVPSTYCLSKWVSSLFLLFWLHVRLPVHFQTS